jgi:hypothetical protein
VRELAAERGLVVSRRGDGAVALRRADLEALAEKLRHGDRNGSTTSDHRIVPSALAVPPLPAPLGDAPLLEGATGSTPAAGRPEGAADNDAGAIAAQVFADLQAGHELRQIVVDRRLSPEVVRRVFDEWTALENLDGSRTPQALAKIAQLEHDLAAINVFLAGITVDAQGLHAQVDEVARATNQRLCSLERRPIAPTLASPGADILRRLEALERQIKALPAAPLAIDRRCPGCGHALYSVAACSGCGAGRAALR